MATLKFKEGILNVLISREEKIDFKSAQNLIRKGRRMILQNEATGIVIDIDTASRINKSALDLFNRVLCHSSNFPVALIGG